MYTSLVRIFKCECLRYWRRPGDWLLSVLFYVIVMSLFPLVLPLSQSLLNQIGVGVIWIGIFLAVLMSLPQLFSSDQQEGVLDVYRLTPLPLPLLLLAKVSVQWLLVSLPMIVLTPLMTILYYFNAHQVFYLILSLLVGTPIIHLLGLFVAALILGVRHMQLLLILILVPIAVPTLIFACGAALQFSLYPYLWLGSILSLSVTTMPYLAAVALQDKD